MKKLLAVVLLLLVGAAFGQEKQNQCPIVFKGIRTGVQRNVNLTTGRGVVSFSIRYRNTTEKVIVGAKFQAAFYDATLDLHEVAETWSTATKVKPGKVGDDDWSDGYYIRSYGDNADIWPVKLVFADGSVWRYDGSYSGKANSKDKSGNFVKD